MRIQLLIVGMLFATPCFAGKAHREAQKEFPAKIKTAETAVKTACGCAPKISVDAGSFDKVVADKISSVQSNVGYELEHIATQAKAFCSDADSKKLFCANVKKMVIFSKKDGDIGATYKDKGFTITTSDQSNTGGYKMKEIMDSW